MIIVATHYDDGIGSCAGLAQRARALETPVQLLTVMSRAPLAPFVKHLLRSALDWRPGEPAWLRAREDYRACQRLGVSQHALGCIDALYRRTASGERLYSHAAAFNQHIHTTDWPLVERIADAIDRLPHADTALLFPLGIGHHVDHQLCAHAGLKLLQRGRPVLFFRDFFYAGSPAIDLALLRDAEHWQVALNAREIALKAHAFDAYASQIKPLYGTRAAMHAAMNDREAREDLVVPATIGLQLRQALQALGAQCLGSLTDHPIVAD